MRRYFGRDKATLFNMLLPDFYEINFISRFLIRLRRIKKSLAQKLLNLSLNLK